MKGSMNVIALARHGEQYIFLYDDTSFESLLDQFGQYAADEELNFSWYDAAILSQKVRRIRAEREVESDPSHRRAA
ncbi:hypothetical protein [Stratiformator vulcanicus]|uniref:Uncharacterized protein n=1 Tax=Stratiformator vulcanicus TaxID=2527980 RepID=A0A517R6N4_9PLAN|nr:hypothetical protein [Stratiformator vulcanicus]QDT39515.1 hypothetical protein Pan189_39230 [Stratiformator vulcanicus]